MPVGSALGNHANETERGEWKLRFWRADTTASVYFDPVRVIPESAANKGREGLVRDHEHGHRREPYLHAV